MSLHEFFHRSFSFQHGLFTTVHKYYTVDEWKKFASENPDCLPNMAASAGMAQSDFERLSEVLQGVPGITFICLDVANGYSQHFVDYVRKVRAAFPTHTIIVSLCNTSVMHLSMYIHGRYSALIMILLKNAETGKVCFLRETFLSLLLILQHQSLTGAINS